MRTPEFRKIPKQRRYYNTISVKSNDVTIRWAFRSEDNFYFSVAAFDKLTVSIATSLYPAKEIEPWRKLSFPRRPMNAA